MQVSGTILDPGCVNTARKITVEVPANFGRVQQASATGVTQTVRAGLQLIATTQNYVLLRALRGEEPGFTHCGRTQDRSVIAADASTWIAFQAIPGWMRCWACGATGDAIIAQICIDHQTPLITRDRDFRAFAAAANLQIVAAFKKLEHQGASPKRTAY